jgi:hypothetical protein
VQKEIEQKKSERSREADEILSFGMPTTVEAVSDRTVVRFRMFLVHQCLSEDSLLSTYWRAYQQRLALEESRGNESYAKKVDFRISAGMRFRKFSTASTYHIFRLTQNHL